MKFLRNLALSFFLLLFATAIGLAAGHLMITHPNSWSGSLGSSFFSSKNSLFSSDSSANPVPISSEEGKALISQASPAIVSVYSYQPDTSSESSWQNFPFAPFSGSSSTVQVSAGTGFFVDPDGYILTDRHVVPPDSTGYSVILSDGTKKEARVVYRDPKDDIAVLKISGNNYPTLPLGDSSKLTIGQPVVSAGNAYGQSEYVSTTGKITDLGQSITATDGQQELKLSNVIESSAQLFPGDSGGPTLDMEGKVVGLNEATTDGHAEMNYLTPINEAKDAISAALNSGL
ncbi:MAG: S1C family serine protease [Patescibacteria group bacterium]|nr:S1C family serine protease [Patescibacteria group bacterium]